VPEEPVILAGESPGLFGVLHRPEGNPTLALVFCPPFAEEKKGAHRLLVETARALADHGVAVLRFDYRGTGDSEGSFAEFTLAGAEEDIQRALAFVRAQYPGTPAGLLGVRLGAALAARVAESWPSEAGCAHCLVLWEPVINGRRYAQMNLRQKRIREMLTAKEGAEASGQAQPEAPKPKTGAPAGEGYDFDGYWVTPALHAEMEALAFPGEIRRPPARVLGISVNAAGRVSREMEGALASYTSAGAEIETRAIVAEPFWSLQDPVPVPDLVQTTLSWISDSPAPNGSGEATPPALPPSETRELSLRAGQERPVCFQSSGRWLHGVLSLPKTPARPATGLVTLHGWSGTRIGPHALFVSLARRAAEAGIACLRFDFRGRGDSGGEIAEATRATMIEDAVAAARFLREEGCERVILVGLCAGSQVAIGAAAQDAAPDGLILWSAPVSEQAEEERAVAAKRRHFLREYARKLFRPQTWRKLIGGKLQFGKIARVVSGKAGIAATDDRAVDLQAAARLKEFRGPIFFVYGTHDPIAPVALPYYQRILASGQAEVSVTQIEGANHSFYGTAWREEVLDQTLAWLAGHFPSGGG
jgi:exosortase A-associated hydrolase 2